MLGLLSAFLLSQQLTAWELDQSCKREDVCATDQYLQVLTIWSGITILGVKLGDS